jgi:hypothetical protein
LRRQVAVLERKRPRPNIELHGSSLLDVPPILLVPLEEHPRHGEAGDRRRLASRGLSALPAQLDGTRRIGRDQLVDAGGDLFKPADERKTSAIANECSRLERSFNFPFNRVYLAAWLGFHLRSGRSASSWPLSSPYTMWRYAPLENRRF